MHADYTITWPDGNTTSGKGIETSYGDEPLYQVYDKLRAGGFGEKDLTAVSDVLHRTYGRKVGTGVELDLKPGVNWHVTHNGVVIDIRGRN